MEGQIIWSRVKRQILFSNYTDQNIDLFKQSKNNKTKNFLTDHNHNQKTSKFNNNINKNANNERCSVPSSLQTQQHIRIVLQNKEEIIVSVLFCNF